jgi:hypothetical protein
VALTEIGEIQMDNLGFAVEILQKQRQHDLMEEAKLERFLQEKKDKDAANWMQRHLRRNRRNK